MIHRYIINMNINEPISVPNEINPILINGCQILWQINECKQLENIIIDLKNRPLIKDDGDNILSSYPEIDAAAFNMAVFLANSIFSQTCIDAFDPFSILTSSPELIPESAEEEIIINEKKVMKYIGLTMSRNILGKFDPQSYVSKFDISIAIAHFANAWRSRNPFQKFECFFKVIEYILKKGKNEKAEVFDERVSRYAVGLDSSFTIDVIKNLRQIRNRCVHSNKTTHLSPDDLDSFYMVRSEVKTIERLAKLLIENPQI